MATATATRRRLTEKVSATTRLRVDREKGVIYGVKCLGPISRNGRRYAGTSFSDAVRHYEGIEVNVDHQGPDASAVRPFSDGFGVLREARKTSEGVFADLHYLKSHPMAAMIAEKAERFPNGFGMSHVALGKNARSHCPRWKHLDPRRTPRLIRLWRTLLSSRW